MTCLALGIKYNPKTKPMPEQLQIKFGFVSEKGKRKTNEDFVAAFTGNSHQCALRGMVTAITDGMGSVAGGRQAAETTVRGFFDAYYNMPETLGVERAAARALSAMNRWVYAQARQDPELKNMATTFSALILHGRQAHVIHVGDSRIYRLRKQKLQRLTNDHVHDHPDMHHVLLRAVGLEDSVRADCAQYSLKQHDRFLLCSDGVHGALTDKQIQVILDERGSPEEGARRIVDAALDAGSHDNATALVQDVIGLPPPDQSTLEAALGELPILELPKAGDTVDDFQLEAVLFNGRYSRLFYAWDSVESCEVVLKFPHPRVTHDASHHQAFAREAWIAARIHSPWVMEMIELPPGRQSRLYSVAPAYSGETLEQRLLHEQKISLEEGIDIGIRLAKAVYALNRLRIIHRDIKPENVMLLKEGGLKLLDLGVARLPGIQDDVDQGAPGTPSFMAPELFRGRVGDERSEVYALGVTLYRLFSGGQYPYGEVEAFSRPRFTKYTPLVQHRPDLPAWLDAVLAQAAEVDANKRYGDTMELVFELENGLAHGSKLLPPEKKPLIERDPVKVWQTISLILALALLAVLFLTNLPD
ncbi:MAG: bifunctional protein-serine/threonine kinase/phosphatase [Gammaproteobacteria bacterium]|nr:MAG: bifunctional protein-serine/threonine kinase/phosphatase [Gammaproteobacteria bacterium]